MFSKIKAQFKSRAVQADAPFAALRQRGDAALEKGDFAEAARCFGDALAAEPGAHSVLNKLGFCLTELGRFEEALQHLQRAPALESPSANVLAETHYLLANLAKIRGTPQQAVQCLQSVIACDPQFEPAYRDLCFLLLDASKLDDAQHLMQAALQQFPDSAEFHFYLGNIFHEQRRWEAASSSFRAALELAPDYAFAYVNLSAALQEQGEIEQALAMLEQALARNPDVSDWHVKRGYLLQLQSRFGEAFEAYQRAIAMHPTLARAHANLGSLYEHQEQLELALACYREAAMLEPDNPDFLFNLGAGLQARRDAEDAIACYEKILQIAPGNTKAMVNLAVVLSMQGRMDEALACYDKVLAMHPEMAQVHVNKAYLLLKLGRFPEGWREYEYRWQCADAPVRVAFTQPLWLGQQDLQGKAILLYGEQGYGDMLHFVRYASLVAARGATVYLLLPAVLTSLARSCAGVAAVFTQGEDIPPFDFLCPLMSLPLACGTELSSIPGMVPYLHSDPVRVASWRMRLGEKRGLRVGLAWAGDPRKAQPMAAAMDKQRSMPFQQLLPLFDVPGIEFFCLQMGEARAQMEGSAGLRDFTGELHDFQDTACLIENLDLVISVDTSIVHLCGALARPVWMMDRHGHCYRWLPDREDSPWYPSLRIFRQDTPGDWSGVVKRILPALRQLAGTT